MLFSIGVTRYLQSLRYGEPNAISYAKFFSRSHVAVIRVHDESGNVIQALEHKGEFSEP
jgi:hypothetical protein